MPLSVRIAAHRNVIDAAIEGTAVTDSAKNRKRSPIPFR